MDISTNISSLIYSNLKKEFQAGVEDAKTIADPLYQVTASTTDANVYGWLAHTPGFKEWFKGQARVLRNVETFNYRVANRKFEDTIEIGVDDVEDNQLSQYASVAKSIGASGKLVWDELVFDLFNKAFTTTLTYDAKAWCATDHVQGLSTVNNLMQVALTADNFETALTRMGSFKVKADKLSTAKPLCPNMSKLVLLVPPALDVTARKIVDVERVASGADNYNYKRATVLTAPWLTSDTAWFLVNVGASLKPVFLQNRKALEFRQLTPKDSDEGFMKDSLVYGAKMRCAALPSFPYLVIGSSGPAST